MAAKLSGPSGGSGGADAISEINVTPFVDVMLVLLIIFMVAAPLATVSVEVDLPPAVAPPAENPPKPVYLSIQSGGQLFIGDFPTNLSRLGRISGPTSGPAIQRTSASSSAAIANLCIATSPT
jgi:biopolymer transport protein ExbD